MAWKKTPGPPPDERRCTAKYSKNNPAKPGERCTQWAMKGQRVCFHHGGAAPQNRKAAARRIAEAELQDRVTRQLARLDVDPVDNPLTALAQLAGEVTAFKNALGDRVNALEEFRYRGTAGEQIRAEITLYERALDRCNTVLGNIARLNIDERLAAITERQAKTIIAAIDAAITHLGIAGPQATEVKRVVARHLRAL